MTTISQERAGLVKVGRPLINREKWGARFTRYDEARSVTEPAPLVFVHITITNPSNYASDEAHMRAVEAIGISRFPNTGISYNRGLFQSGKAMEGQPVGRRGAHTINDKNITRCASTGCPHRNGPIPSAATNLNTVVRAYAICQNIDDPVTDKQLDSLARTIAADMLAGFVRKDADIHGHRCVANKDCPGSKMWALMPQLRALVDKYVADGFQSAPPTGEDMTTPTDVVGTDLDGSPMTMAELSARMNYLYQQVTGDGFLTPDKFRAMVQAENEEYGTRLWGAPSGTGTALIAAVADLGAAVAAIAQQIASEDTADDAEFRAAMSNLDTTLADLKAAVEAPKA